MKLYKLKVKNSNGQWAFKKTFTAENDKKAYNYAELKTAETGFSHKAEFQSKVNHPDIPDTLETSESEDLENVEVSSKQEKPPVLEKEELEEKVDVNSEEELFKALDEPENKSFLSDLKKAIKMHKRSVESGEQTQEPILTEEEKKIIEEHNPDDFDPNTYDWEYGYDESDFPRAWWLKNVFVSKDGSVFHQKEKNSKLYRKLKPSNY